MSFLGRVTDYETMSRVSYGQTTFNLSRMNRLLASVDNPQKNLRMVHIAGTKGKGSTAAMLSSMLQAAGYRVGVFSSPHVLDIRERITVNDTWISEQEFVRCVNLVAAHVRASTRNEPTFFELITAMAFLHFAEEDVDVAIIETGLGGRLDATNVIKPELCCITNISYDHMSLLGDTLEEIATEKAGILKQGIPAISSPQSDEVKKVLKDAAEKVGAPLQFTGDEIEFSYRFESSRMVGPHSRVCLTTPTSHFEHLQVPLPGEHQAVNCGLALAMLDNLKTRGFEVEDQQAIEGLAKARLAGRMEVVCETPKILVDGAHNAASIEALMRTIGQCVPYDSMVVIFGCQTGKDVAGMIRHVQLGADKLIFTAAETPNAVDPKQLISIFKEQSSGTAQVAATLDEAMTIAQGAVSEEDLICITGSFYLVGEAKRRFSD